MKTSWPRWPAASRRPTANGACGGVDFRPFVQRQDHLRQTAGRQLRVLGLNPVLISLDDYFVDREKTPRDENGEYDYEALEAIDLEQFNDHLKRLERGESVDIPRYDFISGTRQWHDNPLQLDERSVLIVEGIHGLNPALTPGVPEPGNSRSTFPASPRWPSTTCRASPPPTTGCCAA